MLFYRTKLQNEPNHHNGLENRSDHEPDGKASLSGSNYDKSTESSTTTCVNNDVTYASQLSLENPNAFSRDAFGRQSMSEKRHATLDAKSTDTYQRTKKLREERDKNKHKDSKYKSFIQCTVHVYVLFIIKVMFFNFHIVLILYVLPYPNS